MNGAVAELVDAGDSKSPGVKSLRVRVSPALPLLGGFYGLPYERESCL